MAEYLAQGTKLSVDKTGGGTYTDLADIVSFDGPSNTVGKIKTTNLSSARHTYLPGLPDGGDLSFDLNFDAADATHTYLRSLADTLAVLTWQVSYPTLPKATLDTFSGFLTEFKPSGGGADELITASVTIAITGAITTTTAP